MKVRLTAHARADLADTRAFTIEQWSHRQWLRYHGELKAALRRIGQNTRAGQSRDDLLDGLRVLPCRSHMIFWLVEADGRPTVVRVLHQRRDPVARHFSASRA